MCGVIDTKNTVGSSSRDLFYLDLSKNFKDSLPIIEISSNLPVKNMWTTANAYGSTIFLCGGWLSYVSNGTLDNIDYVFTFSTQDNTWQRPSIYGTPPTSHPLAAVSSVIDKAGKIYLFGGDNGTTAYSKMYILDTINLTWLDSSDAGMAFNKTLYASVLLNNGEILYIGGLYPSGPAGAVAVSNEIYLFDIRKNAWTTEFISNITQATTGKPTTTEDPTTASVSTSPTTNSNPQSSTTLIAISEDMHYTFLFLFHIFTAALRTNDASAIDCPVLLEASKLSSCHRIRLADFKIKGYWVFLDESTMTTSSALKGMPGYINPQCVLTYGFKRNKKSDIFSYGIILWEVSSCKPPCPPLNPIEGTPRNFVELYKRCQNITPDERPNIEEIVSILQTLAY
ncbi:7926_t:CDS:2 [Acaulospora morrowiae]|uniref:7926_t:CDS:1 n=1 Tax=Acaulospora morrowiae TaxID=94023 RepID=A0A9N8Z6C2_9GLOM|nr:7926_t:CDS:2 [Acaulospora morrowiae]